MPAAYYTFTAGPAQFFVLDTDMISENQLLWLSDALDASRARIRSRAVDDSGNSNRGKRTISYGRRARSLAD